MSNANCSSFSRFGAHHRCPHVRWGVAVFCHIADRFLQKSRQTSRESLGQERENSKLYLLQPIWNSAAAATDQMPRPRTRSAQGRAQGQMEKKVSETSQGRFGRFGASRVGGYGRFGCMHKASDRLSRGAGGTSGLSFPGLSSIAPVSKI